MYMRAIPTLALILLLWVPVSASVQTIPQGGTIFVGEEGLDIHPTGVPDGAVIGWWGAGAKVSAPPVYTFTVTDAGSFYASPITFAERTGNWYLLPEKRLVFTVQSPTLALRIFDDSRDLEATGRWIPAGDLLSFRIESNLYEMTKRPGAGGAPVTIRVQGPSGAEYTSLVGPGGDRTRLSDIMVNMPVYNTGPIWYTGDRTYTRGNYSVWAECNANSMKDNYEVVGRTITAIPAGGNLQILGENPDITKKRAATANVTQAGTTVPPTPGTTVMGSPVQTPVLPVSTGAPVPGSPGPITLPGTGGTTAVGTTGPGTTTVGATPPPPATSPQPTRAGGLPGAAGASLVVGSLIGSMAILRARR